ncbi:MAG: FmdE family protein [Syntrophobacteraceae bacterium]
MNDTNAEFHRLLDEAVRFHGHLCGGQVIGVRMAMAGLRELNIKDPRSKEVGDLVIFVEIDRCAADALISVTGKTPGRRCIKMMDYGKMAATFFHVESNRAVRVNVKGDSNEKVDLIAQTFIPRKNEKDANIEALMMISEEDLLGIRKVSVTMKPEDLPGKPLESVICKRCGEMVKDKRQVILEGAVLCKPCAEGQNYYTVVGGKGLA